MRVWNYLSLLPHLRGSTFSVSESVELLQQLGAVLKGVHCWLPVVLCARSTQHTLCAVVLIGKLLLVFQDACLCNRLLQNIQHPSGDPDSLIEREGQLQTPAIMHMISPTRVAW
jgi:hypothetical protein